MQKSITSQNIQWKTRLYRQTTALGGRKHHIVLLNFPQSHSTFPLYISPAINSPNLPLTTACRTSSSLVLNRSQLLIVITILLFRRVPQETVVGAPIVLHHIFPLHPHNFCCSPTTYLCSLQDFSSSYHRIHHNYFISCALLPLLLTSPESSFVRQTDFYMTRVHRHTITTSRSSPGAISSNNMAVIEDEMLSQLSHFT